MVSGKGLSACFIGGVEAEKPGEWKVIGNGETSECCRRCDVALDVRSLTGDRGSRSASTAIESLGRPFGVLFLS